MRIAICDDNQKIADDLAQRLKTEMEKHVETVVVEVYYDGAEVLKHHRENKFDALFLDIQMPEPSGFDVAREIRGEDENTPVVFVTSFDSFVYEAFNFGAFHFLRKDQYDNDIPKIIERLMKYFERTQRYYVFSYRNENIKLPYSDIVYFQGEHNCAKIITKEKEYQQKTTLKNIEEQLQLPYFVRIHLSYIVNIYQIEKIMSNLALMKNGKAIAIRSKSKELREKYSNLFTEPFA